ncbi:PA2928 family protein [Jiangella endophytica]|uniref:PA2928 family protein n=1 Tax=Jiangella endophytica TaxID=1623398 RepID=UPI0013007E8A|nr:PA2928 family protein [Jiangella endophytica]
MRRRLLVILALVVAAAGAGVAALAAGGVDGPTRPSLDLAVTTVDGRDVAVVAYEHEAGGAMGRILWAFSREVTIRVAAIDLGTGEHLWDREISTAYPGIEAGVLAAGDGYAYVTTDDGLVIVDLDDGGVVARDDGIDGLGAAYLASLTAYDYDAATNAVVTLTSGGEVLAVPVGTTTAEPAGADAVTRWRDVLNTGTVRDLYGNQPGTTSKSALAADGSSIDLNTWATRTDFYLLDTGADRYGVAAGSGFLVLEALEHPHSRLSIVDPETYEPAHTYRLPGTLRQVVNAPGDRVLILTENDEYTGLLVVATAGGFTEFVVGAPGMRWF